MFRALHRGLRRRWILAGDWMARDWMVEDWMAEDWIDDRNQPSRKAND
jgi:hypothetical protein